MRPSEPEASAKVGVPSLTLQALTDAFSRFRRRRALFLLGDLAGQLRLLARRQVAVDDALGGGLVELLDGQAELRAGVLDAALRQAGQKRLDLLLDGTKHGAVVQPTLLGLAIVLLGAAGVRHRSSPAFGSIQNAIVAAPAPSARSARSP